MSGRICTRPGCAGLSGITTASRDRPSSSRISKTRSISLQRDRDQHSVTCVADRVAHGSSRRRTGTSTSSRSRCLGAVEDRRAVADQQRVEIELEQTGARWRAAAAGRPSPCRAAGRRWPGGLPMTASPTIRIRRSGQCKATSPGDLPGTPTTRQRADALADVQLRRRSRRPARAHTPRRRDGSRCARRCASARGWRRARGCGWSAGCAPRRGAPARPAPRAARSTGSMHRLPSGRAKQVAVEVVAVRRRKPRPRADVRKELAHRGNHISSKRAASVVEPNLAASAQRREVERLRQRPWLVGWRRRPAARACAPGARPSRPARRRSRVPRRACGSACASAAATHPRRARAARAASAGGWPPSSSASSAWRGADDSRSAPRTTSVIPIARSSTTTASW